MLKKYLWLILGAFLLLCGCQNTYDGDVRITAGKDGGLLAVASYNSLGKPELISLRRFSLTASGKDFKLTDAGEYRGILAGMHRAENGYYLIFSDGAVFILEDGAVKLKRLSERVQDFRLISACGNAATLYALNYTPAKTIELLKFDSGANKWEDYKLPLPEPGMIAAAEVSIYKDSPLVFWKTVDGELPSAGIRGAYYQNYKWHYLLGPTDALYRGAFTVCGLETGIFLWQESLFTSNSTSGGLLSYYDATSEAGGWHLFSAKTMPASDLARTVSLSSSTYANRLWVCRLGVDGVRIAYSDAVAKNIWHEVGTPAEKEVSAFDSPWLMPVLAFFFALIVIRLMRRRMQNVLKKAGRLYPGRFFPVPTVASPIDRAVALAIDGFIVSPFPLAYFGFTVDMFNKGAGAGAFQSSMELVIAQIMGAGGLTVVWLWLAALIIYSFFAELFFRRTIGKKLLDLEVRSVDGSKARLSQILLRNLLRLVDFYPVSIGGSHIWYLIAMLSVSVTRRRQRVGDLFARTIVRKVVSVNKRHLILASASPRRRELLSELGYNFSVEPANVDEVILSGVDPREMVERISSDKARAVAQNSAPDALVIAADTAVILDGRILGKPNNRQDALKMLKDLSGKTHQVITAVTIVDNSSGQFLEGSDMTEVTMRNISDELIHEYIATGEADDKAGAYAIQGEGGKFVTTVTGSVSNVIGFPVELVQEMLKDLC